MLVFFLAQALAAPVPAAPWKVRQIAGGELRYIQPMPRQTDYPKAALRAGLEGRTVVQLTISPEGTILSCAPVQSAGSPELDQQACIMYRQRSRFQLIGIDKPITVRAPISWMLADGQAPEPAKPAK